MYIQFFRNLCIPSSSPSSFESGVLRLWQRNFSHDEVIIVPSLYPSGLPVGYLSIVQEKERFEVSGSSESDVCSKFPRLLPCGIPT